MCVKFIYKCCPVIALLPPFVQHEKHSLDTFTVSTANVSVSSSLLTAQSAVSFDFHNIKFGW